MRQPTYKYTDLYCLSYQKLNLYHAVLFRAAENRKGEFYWRKYEILVGIQPSEYPVRMSKRVQEYAERNGILFLPYVKHNSPVNGAELMGVTTHA